MAGGTFTPYKFHLNPKCIFISIFLALSYWFLPHKNPIVLFFMLVITYIAIGWYDYLYKCQLRMYSGSSGISYQSLLKPQYRNKQEVQLVPNQEYIYLKTVYSFHLFVIAPLLLSAGVAGYKQLNIKWLFSILSGTGFIAGIYHGMRLFNPRKITPTFQKVS